MAKVDLLGLLSDGDWWTSPEVADAQGVSLAAASTNLRRVHLQSLVRRQQIPTGSNSPRLYGYQITAKGLERLEYLSSSEVQAGGVVADRAEMIGMDRRTFENWVAKKLRR